jgi:hypothetical protein
MELSVHRVLYLSRCTSVRNLLTSSVPFITVSSLYMYKKLYTLFLHFPGDYSGPNCITVYFEKIISK